MSMPRINITSLRPTPSGLLRMQMEIEDHGRVLHRWNRYIPPLEWTYTAQECRRRAAAHATAAQAVVQQMYMSTTRGLTP